MKLTDDLGDLSPRGTAALFGAMALCCLVPMLLIFGVVSAAGALFGGTAVVIVGVVAVLGWGAWSGRHHRHMAQHHADGGHSDPRAAHDQPHTGAEQSAHTN